MTKDQERIVELLCGRAEQDQHGLPAHIYMQDGSAEELEARRALARLLRSSTPIEIGLRCILADLIDPDRDEVDRQIKLKNRREGKPSNALAEKTIAEYIEAMLTDNGETRQLKYAISKAEERFGLGRTRLLEIWREWRPILARLKR
jgi:hypothetical protein